MFRRKWAFYKCSLCINCNGSVEKFGLDKGASPTLIHESANMGEVLVAKWDLKNMPWFHVCLSYSYMFHIKQVSVEKQITLTHGFHAQVHLNG